jgi:hypothetical protein
MKTLLGITALSIASFLVAFSTANESNITAHAQTAPTVRFSNTGNFQTGTASQVDPAGQLVGRTENLPNAATVEYCFEDLDKASGDNARSTCDYNTNWLSAQEDPNWQFRLNGWMATFDPVGEAFPGSRYRFWFRDSRSGIRSDPAEFTISRTGQGQLNSCHELSREDPVPDGFGAAFNTISQTNELLMTGACNEFSVDITVGNGDPMIYTHQTAYHWTNNTWQPFQLTCDNEKIDLEWCVGSASGTVNNILARNRTFVIGYTCQWVGGNWACGCRDNVCASKFWQVQAYQSEADFVPLPPTIPVMPPAQ